MIFWESKWTKEILISLCITKYSLSETLYQDLEEKLVSIFPIGKDVLGFQVVSVSII